MSIRKAAKFLAAISREVERDCSEQYAAMSALRIVVVDNHCIEQTVCECNGVTRFFHLAENCAG